MSGQFDTFGRELNPAANDRAYFDKYSLQAVPEPTRGLMLMLASIAALRRRRG